MGVDIIYEYPAATADDEAGRITGRQPTVLSAYGRSQARDLGQRHRGGGLNAVLCSDLTRAVETAALAFGGYRIPRHLDTRLRDCDFGALTGHPVAELVEHDRCRPDTRFPGGEGYQDVVTQLRHFLRDLAPAWDSRCVLIVSHRANRLALEHLLTGRDLAELLRENPAGTPPQPSRWFYRLPDR